MKNKRTVAMKATLIIFISTNRIYLRSDYRRFCLVILYAWMSLECHQSCKISTKNWLTLENWGLNWIMTFLHGLRITNWIVSCFFGISRMLSAETNPEWNFVGIQVFCPHSSQYQACDFNFEFSEMILMRINFILRADVSAPTRSLLPIDMPPGIEFINSNTDCG